MHRVAQNLHAAHPPATARLQYVEQLVTGSLLLLFVFSILISWTMGKSPSVRCPAMLCMAVALSMARAELDEVIDGLADDVHDWSRDPRALDFTSADANGDGAVDRSEYLAFFRAPMERLRLKDHERLKSALEASDRMRGNIFQRLDRDSDARLSRDEWDRVFISPAHGGRPGGAGDAGSHSDSIQERLRKDGRLLHLLTTAEAQDMAFQEADTDRSGALMLAELQVFMAAPHDEMEREEDDSRRRRTENQRALHDARRNTTRAALEVLQEERGLAGAMAGALPARQGAADTRAAQEGAPDPGAEASRGSRAREREIDARMAAARRRIRHARARQVERTFTNLDADADGLLSLHEWRAGLSRHAGRREPGAAGMQATAVTAAHVASPKRSVPLPAENKTSAARVE